MSDFSAEILVQEGTTFVPVESEIPTHDSLVHPIKNPTESTGTFLLNGPVVVQPGGVLTLNFTQTPSAVTPFLTGNSMVAANWLIAGPTAISVVAVAVVGLTVQLTTTHPFQIGGTYQLTIPSGIMNVDLDLSFAGPFTPTFLGAGDTCNIILAVAVDARLLQVTFDKAPGASALVAANYTVDHGLQILGAAKQSDFVYLLTTSHQLIGTTYTVTSPGVTT